MARKFRILSSNREFEVEVEDLENESNNPAALAALTAPGSKIKSSPQVSPEVFTGEIGEPVLVSEAVATEDLSPLVAELQKIVPPDELTGET